jgi:hypothetical protein
MRTPFYAASRKRGDSEPVVEGQQGRADPGHPMNDKGPDNTETSVIYDSANDAEIDFTFEGYTDNLFWFSGAGPDAPNGQPYWERLGTASSPFKIDLTPVDTTGWIEAELWAVIQAENDPETAPLNLSGAPFHFGSGTDVPIYPTADLGSLTRNVLADFGATARTTVSDAELVTAGFDAPSLDVWHVMREKVSGTAGAGNLTYELWLDGTLVKSVSGLTSGWNNPPLFWGVEGSVNRGWAGRVAYFQVYDRNLNQGEVNKQLRYLQGRFGL